MMGKSTRRASCHSPLTQCQWSTSLHAVW